MGEWSSGPGPAQPADEDDSDATGNVPGRDPVSWSQSADPADPAQQPPNVEPPYQPTQAARPYQPTEVARPYQPTEVARPYQPTEVSRPYQPTEVSRPYSPTEMAPPQQPDAPYVPRHQPPTNVPPGQVPTNVPPGRMPANTPPGQMPTSISFGPKPVPAPPGQAPLPPGQVPLPPGQVPTNYAPGRPPARSSQPEPPMNAPPPAYQPPAYQPPVSAASSDVVRYGPGVPAAAVSQAGVTAEQVWRTGRLPEPPKRKARMRRMLGSALTVILLIAAGVVLYLRFHHAPFQVSSVKITSETKNGCGVNVTGEIGTNGASGTVSYQWVFQPQVQAPQPLSQSVVSGQHSVFVTVAVEGQGHGSATQKVTLQLLSPGTGSATESVTVSC
jgi:hypothetical protein